MAIPFWDIWKLRIMQREAYKSYIEICTKYDYPILDFKDYCNDEEDYKMFFRKKRRR